MCRLSLLFCLSSNNVFFSSGSTENILAVTNREFVLQNVMGMRTIQSRPAYIELLDCLVRSVVGRKVYVDNRLTKPLSVWFTLTDEAFLLLCLESYVPKWNRAWALASQPPVAAPAQEPLAQEQQEEGAEQQQRDEDDARYTGRSRGTKRSWSREGLERFNALMIDVYRDRQTNGTHFDNIFREEMIKRYGKQNDNTNPGMVEHEQIAPENRVVQVYSDFNMEQFMAHATAGTSSAAVGVASRVEEEQQEGHDEEEEGQEVTSRVMV